MKKLFGLTKKTPTKGIQLARSATPTKNLPSLSVHNDTQPPIYADKNKSTNKTVTRFALLVFALCLDQSTHFTVVLILLSYLFGIEHKVCRLRSFIFKQTRFKRTTMPCFLCVIFSLFLKSKRRVSAWFLARISSTLLKYIKWSVAYYYSFLTTLFSISLFLVFFNATLRQSRFVHFFKIRVNRKMSEILKNNKKNSEQRFI